MRFVALYFAGTSVLIPFLFSFKYLYIIIYSDLSYCSRFVMGVYNFAGNYENENFIKCLR